ncbi:DUF364 domain-containing protein [Desulfogranum marinum]|uniref:DUF364 domain-containing protein n=1 Tax=Desulfogranum marinum TaxID=453220 RepID=UPI001962374E|nr:DUF364 domain-containing protein [Desulfogranum marinum]MBM9513096.1 DUF364 domain-containing protein [Desulfogranum marinum]
MNHTIPQKIINLMAPVAEELTVADVRIGLVYTSVRLDNGNTGVAWTGQKSSGGCGQQPKAGTLVGRPAGELLQMLDIADSPLSKTIGLATANALTADIPSPETVSDEILELIDIQPSEHVAMVGFFGPLVPRLRQTGCRLDVQELKNDKPGTISPDAGRSSLAACDVALITATSIVTDTIDEVLADLGNARAAVVLGPSSFMHPEVFFGTPVTHIAGARVRNPSAVEKIISEGGGTKILKKHMDFETICLNP